MNKLLKIYPLPISGFALALFTMASLLSSYSKYYKYIFLALGLLVLFLFILKLIKMPKEVLEILRTNPLGASAFPTFFMANVALAGHIYDYNQVLAKFIYILMLILFLIYTLYFIRNFVVNFSIKNVFTTWYIVFVGPAIFLVHSRIVDKTYELNAILFYTSTSFLICMILILYRVLIVGYKEELIRATLLVLSAPGSLLFLAYHNFIGDTAGQTYIFIYVLSQFFYAWVLFYIPGILKGKLHPTVSAMTFPMVTGVFSTKLFAISCTNKFIDYAYYFQLSIALIIIAITLLWHIKTLGYEMKRK
ncbi:MULTISPECIES: hypothetical protein [unclassified Gemella]|uniref:SLAC1 family transporter n=1 Tax=unclassified Gemella TaxID=2624949 RepID=UPI0015D0B24C|nr:MULTISPECIES: hypothetical protein [unclassified Gemella]MBF0710349.1 hypothetical protein [Gemella sp. GL1.1]NYS27693.1 hypothetical protein [Gemella sp. GL1]